MGNILFMNRDAGFLSRTKIRRILTSYTHIGNKRDRILFLRRNDGTIPIAYAYGTGRFSFINFEADQRVVFTVHRQSASNKTSIPTAPFGFLIVNMNEIDKSRNLFFII